jgi:radical SAM protein with 4Fe4S-binding SPASM domain
VCENRCHFCYLGNEERDVHPPFEQVQRIIYELARQEIEEIYFVGGDPCTYPALIQALKLSKDLGMKNTVLSNTLNFRHSLNQVIKYVDAFETTILGATPSEHDRVANRSGAYDILIKNMKAINEEGLGVGIMFNATPQTFDKFFLTVSKLIDLGININYVMIQRIISQGRAHNTLKYSITSVSQVQKLFKDIEKINKELKLKILFEDPFPLCIIDSKYHKFSSRCEWGFSKGSINHKGNVSRCGSDPRYQIGNIFKTELQVLWEESPILRSFRSYKWLPERCQKCSLLKNCGGGCSLSRITDKDHTVDILFPGEIQERTR